MNRRRAFDLRVGICALSSPVVEDQLEDGLAILEEAGAWPVVAPQVFATDRLGLFAGEAEKRLAGARSLLEDGVDVLWLARGGHGLVPLLADLGGLPWQKTGTVVGFSDATALFAVLARMKRRPRLVHGPMVCGLRNLPARALGETFSAVAGAVPGPYRVKRLGGSGSGPVQGILRGGCLSVLASLCGTEWSIKGRGGVLFLEDVAEPAYRLDRHLCQLELAGVPDGLKGVVLGDFEECAPGARRSVQSVLVSRLKSWEVPVFGGLKAGHGALNRPLLIEHPVRIHNGELRFGP